MEYYSVLKKEISYQARKSHETTLNTYHSVKEASLKVCILCDSHYMTSGKGKTLETVKRSVVDRSWEEGGMSRQARRSGFLGQFISW